MNAERTEYEVQRHRGRVLSILGLVGLAGSVAPIACSTGNGPHSGSGLLVAPMQPVPSETTASLDDGGRDVSTVNRPFPPEPTEPRNGDCEKSVDCSGEEAELPPWPYAPPFAKCAVSGESGGTFSERESRKARHETPDACCYVAWRCEGRHPPPRPQIIRGRRLEGGPAIAGEGLGAMLDAELFSVAAFRGLARDLARHGAPADLVARAWDAADDEAAHVIATTRLLALRGESHVIDDRRASLPPPASFPELVRASFVDGCCGEGAVALQLALAARDAGDSEEGCILHAIAEDELRHAELAWSTLAWALASGGSVAREALADGVATVRRDGAPWDATFLEPERARRAAEAYTRELLLPIGEALT